LTQLNIKPIEADENNQPLRKNHQIPHHEEPPQILPGIAGGVDWGWDAR
jgi:hypothetical protein